MKTSKKLQKWVEQGLISQKQADKILLSEQSNNSNVIWKWMYGIAGLFIGLGFILLIGANWDDIPAPIKLLGDFTILAGVLYGAYWSIINKKSRGKELFLILTFLFIGATIGLVGQIFNLSGGWQSFAMTWSLLGIPFVLFSRLLSFNFCWLCLFFSLFNFEWIGELIDYVYKHLDGMILAVIFLSLLSYAGKKLDENAHKYTLLPKAVQILSMFMAYVIIFLVSFVRGAWILFFANINSLLIYIFAFLFFATRMFLAVQTQNMSSFKRNAIAVEVYIFLIFVTRFGNLLMSGIGLIFGGLAVLVLIYLLRKTSQYVKTMGGIP